MVAVAVSPGIEINAEVVPGGIIVWNDSMVAVELELCAAAKDTKTRTNDTAIKAISNLFILLPPYSLFKFKDLASCDKRKFPCLTPFIPVKTISSFSALSLCFACALASPPFGFFSSLASAYKIANVNLNSSVGKHTLDPENLFVKGKNGPFEIFFYLKGLGVIDKD